MAGAIANEPFIRTAAPLEVGKLTVVVVIFLPPISGRRECPSRRSRIRWSPKRSCQVRVANPKTMDLQILRTLALQLRKDLRLGTGRPALPSQPLEIFVGDQSHLCCGNRHMIVTRGHAPWLHRCMCRMSRRGSNARRSQRRFASNGYPQLNSAPTPARLPISVAHPRIQFPFTEHLKSAARMERCSSRFVDLFKSRRLP